MRIHLMLVGLTVAASALATMISGASAEEPLLPRELRHEITDIESLPATFPASGLWQVEHDDQLDGELKPTRHFLLVLNSANSRITGQCKNKRGDEKESDSVFSGECIVGSPSIITLRQDGNAGYTAIYTGRLVEAGKIVGNYIDNRGSAGDWSITLTEDEAVVELIEPLKIELPQEELFESVLGVYGKAIRGERFPLVNLRPPSRNLWTDEIRNVVEESLSYGEVDYIGTARLIIPESGEYTVAIPGAGVQFSINDQRVEAGDIELKKGVYKVEIYTNHWGQPYLTYAEVSVRKQDADIKIPFVNTASDIEEFRSGNINDQPVVEVCKHDPKPVKIKLD